MIPACCTNHSHPTLTSIFFDKIHSLPRYRPQKFWRYHSRLTINQITPEKENAHTSCQPILDETFITFFPTTPSTGLLYLRISESSTYNTTNNKCHRQPLNLHSTTRPPPDSAGLKPYTTHLRLPSPHNSMMFCINLLVYLLRCTHRGRVLICWK